MAKTGYFDYFKNPTWEGLPQQAVRTQLGFSTLGLSEVPMFKGESLANKLLGGEWDPFKDPDTTLSMRNDPAPQMPGYESTLGQGNFIDPRYQLSAGKEVSYTPTQLQVNEQALQNLRDRAQGTGRSSWAQLLTDQSDLEGKFAQDKLRSQGAAETAQAQAQLAMRGGLSGGAAERLAGQGARNIAMQRQQMLQDQMNQRLGIGIEDERQRAALQQALPGMELEYGRTRADVGFRNAENQARTAFQNRQMQMQADQFNIGNTLNDIRGRNAFNQGAYGEQMKAWAANKQADATMAAGNKDSWICTKIDEASKLSKIEKGELARFLRFSLHHQPAITRFYLKECHELVRRMTEAKTDWAGMRWFTDEICEQIRLGKMETAFQRFKHDVAAWIEQFWPECSHPVMHRIRAEMKLMAAQKAEAAGKGA